MKTQVANVTRDKLVKEIARYDMPQSARHLLGTVNPLILCGITAAGKDTLTAELVREGGFEHVISHTTRAPRLNHGVAEQDGQDYFFATEPTMLELLLSKAFVEIKRVHDSFYGTSIDALGRPQEHGNRPVLEIDVQGVEEFLGAVPSLRPVFLLPPSFAVWQERLKGRGVIDESEKKRRFQSALEEIATAQANPAFQLLINEDKVDSAKSIRHGHLGRAADATAVADKLKQDIADWLASN